MKIQRILIVDDNEQNLYLLRVLLTGHGYEVEEALHGQEALEKARRTPPDLVISDILMPVMDGFTLCREWKKDPRLCAIPFVFYTATYTEEKDRALAYRLGANRFIVKPEEPETFLATLREVIAEVANASPRAELQREETLETPEPFSEEEFSYLKQYNEVLIGKLEDKMAQLEKANRELRREIALRQAAAQEVERLNQERLSAILNSMTDVIWSMRISDGKLLFITPSAERLFGHPLFALYDDPSLIRASIHPADRSLYDCVMERLPKTKKTEADLRILRPDTSFTWVRCAVRWIEDAEGHPIRVDGNMADITEKKHLEEELIGNERMAAVGTFANGVAHEFNNIHTAILGYAQLLLERQDIFDADARAFLEQIISASYRARDITEHLLTFCGLNYGLPRRANLTDLVKDLLKAVELDYSRKGIVLEKKLMPVPDVSMIPKLIAQAISHLLSNAEHSLLGRSEKKITVETGADDRQVWLRITDTGCAAFRRTKS